MGPAVSVYEATYLFHSETGGSLRFNLEPHREVVVHGLHADAAQQQEVGTVGRQPHRHALFGPATVSVI